MKRLLLAGLLLSFGCSAGTARGQETRADTLAVLAAVLEHVGADGDPVSLPEGSHDLVFAAARLLPSYVDVSSSCGRMGRNPTVPRQLPDGRLMRERAAWDLLASRGAGR